MCKFGRVKFQHFKFDFVISNINFNKKMYLGSETKNMQIDM